MKRTRLAATGFLVLAMPPGIALAATECEYSPEQIIYAPDASSISVPFDMFEARPGNDARCALAIPTQRPLAPGTFAIYSADYRGFVNADESARITVEGEHSSNETIVKGLVDGGPLLRTYVGTNGGDMLDSTTVLQLEQATAPDSSAAVDSIDYALAATTTSGEIEASLDRLGAARTGVLVQLQPVAGLLTGIDRPFERPDEVRLLGAAGSYLIGLTGHTAITDTVSFDGGVGVFEQSSHDAETKGVMAAGTLRYLVATRSAWKPFAEGGVDAAPLRLRFARDYDDGGDASGSGHTDGFQAGLHGSLGTLFQPDDANQLVLSATLAQDWLRSDAYSEGFDDNNLFAAKLGRETTGLTTLKAGAAWTTAFTPAFDMTLNSAVGHGFAGGDLMADVSFAGTFDGQAQDDDFIEYGARFGFKPSAAFSADLFAQGATGRSAGTHVFWGGSAGYRF